MDALAALKAKLQVNNPSSDLINPSPLSLILALYNKASTECYIDYMQGAAALIKWLSPIEIISAPSEFKIPRLLESYETNELAMLIVRGYSYPGLENYLSELSRVKKAIVYHTMRDSGDEQK